MKTAMIFVFTFLMILNVNAAPIYNVVSSALMPGDSAVYNLDFVDPFGLPIFDVMINSKIGDTEYTTAMNHLGSPDYLYTYEGSQSYANPSGEIEYYGRVEADTLLLTQSYKNDGNQFPPNSILYAELADDAVADTMPGTAGQWLDLTGSAITYSDDRIYARLSNAGGGWPTNQGFDFYAYGFVLYNPDNPNLSATALVYVNVLSIYTPGLYSVNLNDTSFTFIADIQSQTSGNDLHMSCAISDLLQDPSWSQWPPESGYIMTGGLTISIVSLQPNLNDFTYPSAFIPTTQYLNADQNTPPTAGTYGIDFVYNVSVDGMFEYTDADNNLPTSRLCIFDGDEYEMSSPDHNYGDGSTFGISIPWPGEDWHTYYFRFSDGASVIETALDSVYLTPIGIDNESLPLAFELGRNYPNPFNSSTSIDFQLPEASKVELAIYDVTGSKIADLVDGTFGAGKHRVTWDGKDSYGNPVSSGVYFYKIDTGNDIQTNKMVFLK